MKFRIAAITAVFTIMSFSAAAQIQIGVCTRISNVEKLSAAGYDFIEESVGRFLCPDKSEEEFAKNMEVMKKSPLPIRSCNGFLPADIRIVGPEADHQAALKWAETALRRASQAGIQYIVFGSSKSRKVPEGWSKEEAEKQFISLLKEMAPIARKYDVTLVLEPLRSGECNLLNRVEDGCRIVRKIHRKHIRCLADIYHMMCENESPEVLVKNARLIKHCHVAELNGRMAPGTNGEDLTPYYRALNKAGYKGGLSIEGSWKDFDKQLKPTAELLKREANQM